MSDIYAAGTISVVTGSKVATFTGALVSEINFRVGDTVVVDGEVLHGATIAALIDTDEIEFVHEFTGTTGTGLPYVSTKNSPRWNQLGALNAQFAEEMRLIGEGILTKANYALQTDLFADLAWPALALGKVYGDPDPAKKGVYRKDGAVGFGPWTRIGGLPESDAAAADAAAAELAKLQAQGFRDQADDARSDTAAIRNATMVVRDTAITSTTAIYDATVLVRDEALAASEVSGDVKFYDTKALAIAAVTGLPADQIVEVHADESQDGQRTRYRKEGGVLVQKLGFNPTESEAVAGADNAKSMTSRLTRSAINCWPGNLSILANPALSPIDSAAAWQELIDSEAQPRDIEFRVEGYTPVAGDYGGYNTDHIRLGEGLIVPARMSIKGHLDQSNIRPTAGLDGPMFWLNVDPETDGPVNVFPLRLPTVKDLWFWNIDEAGVRKADAASIFRFIGGYHFSDIFVYAPTTLIQQGQGGENYSDLVNIERVHGLAQIGDDHPFILLKGTGDSLHLDQCWVGAEDPTGAGRTMRGNLIEAWYRYGGVINKPLNGDVKLVACTNITIQNGHLETGVITLLSTQAVVDNNMLYMNGAKTGGVDDPANTIPLVINHRSGDADAISYGSQGTVRNTTFYYIQGWVHGYSDKANFQIGGNMAYEFENNYRRYVSAATVANGETSLGVTQAPNAQQITDGDLSYLDFNRYSHLASRRAKWTRGVVGTVPQNRGRWLIEGSLGAQQAGGPAIASLGMLNTTSIPDDRPEAKWQGPTGTVYVRAAIYQDLPREIGVLGTSELTFAVTNGAESMPQFYIDGRNRGAPAMVRVYFGMASNSYDRYVDIPYFGGFLVLNYLDVCGFVAQARTAAAADAVNPMVSDGYELRPGVFDETSTAYGRAKLMSAVDAPPTRGSWRKGDQVIFSTPVNEGQTRLQGYERLTSGTGHVLNTDWGAIRTYIDKPPPFFNDNFDRADQNLTADGNWTTAGTASGVQIVTGAVAHITGAFDMFAAPDLGTPDHFVQADLQFGADFNTAVIAARVIDHLNYVYLRRTAGVWELRKVVANAGTVIGSASDAIAFGDTIRLEVRGDIARAYRNGGLMVSGSLGGSLSAATKVGTANRAVQIPCLGRFRAGVL